ncbi:MAG: hypothetical protein JNM14_11685 [Ferruginibacter sp.]|nr:hypothetical protein [Ferruginibacter sp.]
MNKIKLLLILSICLTAKAVQAQQPEEKTVKPLPAALTKSPAADKASAQPVAKQMPSDAVPAVPSPSNTTVITEDMKGVEIKTGDKKGQEVKNMDRLKTSTIETGKKNEPAPKPKPVAMVAPEG